MKNFFSFKVKNTWKEAIIFYVVVFLLTLSVAMVVGAVMGIVMGEENKDAAFKAGFKIGQILAIVVTLVLGTYILILKQLYTSVLDILLVALGAVLSVFTGLIGGLIPITLLTMRKSRQEALAKDDASLSISSGEESQTTKETRV